MATRVDRAQRIAAGHICLGLFHLVSSSVAHPLTMVGDGRLAGTSLTAGLTPKEQQLVLKLRDQSREMAEILRQLGQRLLERESRQRYSR